MKKKENPIVSILFNLVIPVVILKNGNKWFGFEQNFIGIETSILVLMFALSFPLFYFFNDLRINTKVNFISILGFINVLLTGLIGILGEKYGISRNWFILKEGIIPLIIGLLILLSMKSKTPLLKELIYNPVLFNINKINENFPEDSNDDFNKIFYHSTYLISASFLLSSIIQFFLASYIVTVDPGHSDFNNQVGTMTWVSYFVVMAPCMSMFGYALWKLIAGIKDITGLETDQILNK
ncbi:MAG: VC0807 family protein [Candidatus Neomarinimicrobiota bacterium]